MKKKHKRSFDILSSFDNFDPSYRNLLKTALFFILGFALSIVVSLLMTKVFSAADMMTYGNVILYPLMFIPAMIFAAANSHANEDFGGGAAIPVNRASGSPFTAFTCAMATLCIAFVVEPVSLILPEMPQSLKAAMEALVNGPLWVSVLCTVIFAPFFEEWLCRGIILRSLLQHKKISPATAIVISALAFALIHANLWQGIPAFLIGLLFGLVYYKTGSLTLTITMHATNNLFSVLISKMPALQDKDYLFQAFESRSVYCLVFAACLALLVFFVVKTLRIEHKIDAAAD